MFLPQSKRPSFALIQHNWQSYSFVYINLGFDYRRELGIFLFTTASRTALGPI
jgi:hypothetical protein